MRSDEFLWKVCMEIYRKQYDLALPRADLDKLIETGVTKKPNWFWKYYLSDKTQDEVITKISRKHRLSRLEKERVLNTVWLGASPTGSLWRWAKSRFKGVLKIENLASYLDGKVVEGELEPDMVATLRFADDGIVDLSISQAGRAVGYQVYRGKLKIIKKKGMLFIHIPETDWQD